MMRSLMDWEGTRMMSTKDWRMLELVVEGNMMVSCSTHFLICSVLIPLLLSSVGSLSRRHHNHSHSHSHHQHTSSSQSYHSDHSTASRSTTPLPPTPSRQTRSKSSSNTLGSISRRLGSALPGNTPSKSRSVSRKSSNVHEKSQSEGSSRPLSPLPVNGDNGLMGRRSNIP